MIPARSQLVAFISEELKQPIAEPALAIARAARDRHHGAAVAVLFYGSCLRLPESEITEGLVDLYVLVEDYRRAYGGRMAPAIANALLPPNVFYLEIPWRESRLRCKYAVMRLDQFERACGSKALNVSIWARFSQPARLAWSRDGAAERAVAGACARAAQTMLRNAPNPRPGEADAELLWVGALKETYRAELRAESGDRAIKIVQSDRDRYRAVTPLIKAAIAEEGEAAARLPIGWRWRRILGKSLNLLRLIKAAFTFEGGLDYILWKVKRHSGVEIHVGPWQRRHPLLAAPALAFRLYRKGAFR